VKRLRCGACIAAVLWASAALGQSTEPLVHEGIVDASVEDVWAAWTTTEGLESWLAPHASIDWRIGGRMRSSYDPAGTLDDPAVIENEILSFEPLRMFSMRVSRAPADFPFANTIRDMWTVVYLEPVGAERTRVRLVSLGFSLDEESQQMRTFFDQGNAVTLTQMQQRIGGAAPP